MTLNGLVQLRAAQADVGCVKAQGDPAKRALHHSSCRCSDPWNAHPEGFTWDTPMGPPYWHTPWGSA
jgi:hypothetical protein